MDGETKKRKAHNSIQCGAAEVRSGEDDEAERKTMRINVNRAGKSRQGVACHHIASLSPPTPPRIVTLNSHGSLKVTRQRGHDVTVWMLLGLSNDFYFSAGVVHIPQSSTDIHSSILLFYYYCLNQFPVVKRKVEFIEYLTRTLSMLHEGTQAS